MNRIYLLLFLLFCVINSKGQDEPTQAPKINAFSLKPDNLGAISNSINLFTGDLSLPLNLISLPGKGDLSIDISINYNSNIQDVVEVWNLDAPTSAVGLGWSLSSSQIIVDNKMTGNREDDEYYLSEGGVSTRLVCIGSNSGVKSYRTKTFSNWIITFTASQEKWEITKEDGTKFIYGDQNSSRNTVQWIVKWGNWIGSSSMIAGQQRQGFIWNISEVKNLWGDKVTFTYEVAEQPVGQGGLNHTEASYLRYIIDSWGNEVELVMGNKTTYEYMEPHKEKTTEPDAYQERYEKKFLDKIIVKNGGSSYEEIRFDYQFLGTGNLTKRLLTSVTKVNVLGESLNIMSFEYVQTGPMKGAVNRIISPLGGSVDFEYSPGVSIPYSNREISIQAPAAGYSEPDVWFADDYVVVAWRQLSSGGGHVTGSTGKNVKIRVYTWDGRWIEDNDLSDISGVRMNSDYRKGYHFAAGRDFFAILNPQYSGNNYTLYLYHKDERIPGNWVMQPFPNLYFDDHDEDEEEIYAGDNYVGLSSNAGKLFTYVWDGDSWREQIFNERGGNSDFVNLHSQVSFGHNYFIHQQFASDPDIFKLFYLDESRNWVTVNQSVNYDNTFSLSGETRPKWYGSNVFAFTYRNGGNEYIFRWDENYNLFAPWSIGESINHSSYTYISNSTVSTAEAYISPSPIGNYRFNGVNWIGTSASAWWFPAVNFANDIYTYGTTGESNKSQTFNPNTNLWESKITYGTGNTYYTQFTTHNSIFQPSIVKLKNNQGSWIDHARQGYIVDIATDKYFLTHNSDGTVQCDLDAYSIEYLKNGSPFDAKRFFDSEKSYRVVTGNGEAPNSKRFLELISPNSFVVPGSSYNCDFMLTTDLKLYRLINYSHQGNQTDYPIVKVTVNSGSNLVRTFIDYDLNKATYDPSGSITIYNKVTVIPESLSKPFGHTENYFFNGLSPTELGETFPGAPAANNYKLFTGSVYRTKIVDSLGAAVSVTENFLDAVSHNIVKVADPSQTVDVAYSIRPNQTINTTDEIQHVNEYTYYDEEISGLRTHQLKTTKTYTGPPGDQYGILNSPKVTLLYQYGWQKYSQLLQQNILTPIVQTNKIIGNTTTAASVTRWKDWYSQYSQSGTVPAPFDTYIIKAQPANYDPWGLHFFDWDPNITPGAEWQFISKINSRDSYSGTPLETYGSSGQVSTIILDQTKSKTLAQISNATFNDVAFTSFDDATSGNFTIPDGVVTQGICKTGIKFMNLGTIGLIKSSLNSSKTYTISFWAKSNGGVVSIDGFGTIPITSPTTWTYYEFSISNKLSTFIKKIGTTDINIDEVRLHPINASMSTYTYHPIFGVTSQTDKNNQTIYIDYDNFGRQKAVYNDDRDVVSTNQYKIKQ
jgi:hypothetical protein